MNQLGIFAKYWQPGQVKTRLAADIGDVAASEIYRGFVTASLVRLAEQAKHCMLYYTPPSQHEAFQTIAGSWQLHPQREGDLGTRMRGYFDDAFAAGRDRVILLGTDSPNVPLSIIEQAFTELTKHDVVLGPTPDGGYFLIGARAKTPNVFDNVAWSTATVWQQTVARLDRECLTYATLPTWYDVDDVADLQRLRDDLREVDDAHLLALRETIDQQAPSRQVKGKTRS